MILVSYPDPIYTRIGGVHHLSPSAVPTRHCVKPWILNYPDRKRGCYTDKILHFNKLRCVEGLLLLLRVLANEALYLVGCFQCR